MRYKPVLHGSKVLFKGEKQFISIPCHATLFYNYPCLHVGSLNHSCAAAQVGFCQCGVFGFVILDSFRKLCHR